MIPMTSRDSSFVKVRSFGKCSLYFVSPTGTTLKLWRFGRNSVRSWMVRSNSAPSLYSGTSTICPFMVMPASFSRRILLMISPAKRLCSILHRSSGFVV